MARTRRDFQKHADEILKAAESRGEIAPEQVRELIEGAEAVLEKSVGLLDTHPSGQNMDAVLEDLEGYLQVGGESDDKAWKSLAGAAGKMRDRVERQFRQNPTTANLDKMLEAQVTNQKLGGPPLSQPPRARPGTFHTVAPGESLSAISQKYYGKPQYWDLIYFENVQKIGDNPDKLPVGLKLVIP